MVNFCYTSFHSQHNESLICENIQYICVSVHTWKIGNNQYNRWNQQRLSPGWLAGWGQIVFVSYRSPHGAVGTGEGVVHEYSLERGWGHDVGWGQRGSQVGYNVLGKPKSFPILSCVQWNPLPRELQNSSKSKER